MALGDIGNNFSRGGEAELAVDLHRGGEFVLATVEDEAAVVIHRAAFHDDGLAANRPAGVGDADASLEHVVDVHAAYDIGKRDFGDGFVDHDAHGAVGIVTDHVDEGTLEHAAVQIGRGDEKLALQAGENTAVEGGLAVAFGKGGVLLHVPPW